MSVLSLTGISANYASGGSFNISETGFGGTFTCTSSNTAVCTVTASVAGPSGAATITPVGPGNSTITVSDGTQTAFFIARVTGELTLSLFTLTFAFDDSPTQTFTATELNYDGLISSSDSTGKVAVVGDGSGPGPRNFAVTPTGSGAGTDTITIQDDHGGSKTVAITVSSGHGYRPRRRRVLGVA